MLRWSEDEQLQPRYSDSTVGAKLLAKRLQKVLSAVIDERLNAFLVG